MNVTHQFYQKLVETNPALVQALEKEAAHLSEPEARTCLPGLLQEQVPFPEDSLDYARLYALLRRSFQGCDLSGEDFSSMPLDHFNFTNATLKETRFQHAVLNRALFNGADLSGAMACEAQMRCVSFCESGLRGADLSKADCTSSDFDRADLTGANLRRACLSGAMCQHVSAQGIQLPYADLREADFTRTNLTGACMVKVNAAQALFYDTVLTYADLSEANLQRARCSNASYLYSTFSGANLQGADLSGANVDFANLENVDLRGANLSDLVCTRASFGRTWCIDRETRIGNNHTLIGMALLSQARTVEQQQLALYVRYQSSLCWSGFLQVLLQRHRGLAAWAKGVLGEIVSLQGRVNRHGEEFEFLLRDRRESFDLTAIHPQLHALLLAEIAAHPTLPNTELYWYLAGILEMASRQPDMHVDDVQHQAALAQLRRFTNIEEPE